MNNLSTQAWMLLQEWEIEKNFHMDVEFLALTQTWEIPVFLSIIYLVMVFQGTKYMANKESYSLRGALFVWSGSLAVFSIIASYRTLIAMNHILRTQSLKYAVCDSKFYTGPITRLWAGIFTFTKFFEYIDTAFIILRKQKLMFLHWYHHFTVALFCWLMYGGQYAGGNLFMTLNYFIHALMYTYYTAKAAKLKVPRIFSMGITFLQILQMVAGCLIMVSVVLWRNEKHCPTSLAHQLSGSLMYASYLMLFMNFFSSAYFSKRAKPSKAIHQEKMENGKKLETDGDNQQKQQYSSSNLRKRI